MTIFEFARKHVYEPPTEIKLVLAHEYWEHTAQWCYSFNTTLEKLDIGSKWAFEDKHPSYGTYLTAIKLSGVAIISTCYDKLLMDYLSNHYGIHTSTKVPRKD